MTDHPYPVYVNMPLCPCGLNSPFNDCCGRHISGACVPQTAEQLMRSRYSAFVTGERDYLLSSWHPDTRPGRIRLNADDRWLGLQIRAATGGADDTEGQVEFVARVKRAGKATRLHETSRFTRVDGKWCYLDGDHHS